MFQAAVRTKTPVLLLGQAVCPANASTPQMNPYVFCGGSTSDPNTAAALAGPAGQGSGREEQGQAEAGAWWLWTSRSAGRASTTWKSSPARSKIEVVDKQSVPPAAADVSGAAARIIANNANYVTSWAPVTTAVQMLGRLATPGMERLVHPQSLRRGRGHAPPAEGSEARHEPGICLLGR